MLQKEKTRKAQDRAKEVREYLKQVSAYPDIYSEDWVFSEYHPLTKLQKLIDRIIAQHRHRKNIVIFIKPSKKNE